eukprot:329907-Amphidinium_carterae.1
MPPTRHISHMPCQRVAWLAQVLPAVAEGVAGYLFDEAHANGLKEPQYEHCLMACVFDTTLQEGVHSKASKA